MPALPHLRTLAGRRPGHRRARTLADAGALPRLSGAVDDPLVRTSVPFGGMINELKKRFPLYKSDIVDSASLMCIAAIIFIFFAALSGAIAFGGLYGTYYLQLWSLEIV